MKKTKKALASLAIAGMVLSMAPASVFAADDNRIAGADRYATSIAIAEKAYTSATTAVIAAGNPANLVDALAAAPLAAQEKAPIYLTDKGDMNDSAIASLKKLGVSKVIVVGAAASEAVVKELKDAGLTVEEVKGAGRVETAEAIGAKLTAPKGTIVVGYNGVADAMSVASYAAANGYQIVVAKADGTTAATAADYVIGGPTLVKDVAKAERIYGADRYETNKKVIETLTFSYNTVYVANGATLADALVASVLAAQTKSPIALSDGRTVKAAAAISAKMTEASKAIALGGTGVVSAAALNSVAYKTPDSLAVESVTALNGIQLEVKFNKEIDQTTAEDEGNYLIVKNDGTTLNIKTDGAKLQSDDKRVILTMDNAFHTEGKSAIITVSVVADAIQAEEDASDVAPLYNTVLTVKDDTDATISKIEAETSDEVAESVKITFSEPVNAGVIKINGDSVGTVTAGSKTTTITGLELDAEDSHTLTIVNLTDSVGNVVATSSKTFTVSTDTAAPVVESVKQYTDNSVLVTFSEKMDADTVTTAGNIGLKDEVLNDVGNLTVVADPDDDDNMRFIIQTDDTTLFDNKSTRTLTVLFDDEVITDELGNEMDAVTKTVTLTKDTTAPGLSSTRVLKNSDGDVTGLELQYNEAIAEGTFSSSNITVVDKNGVDVTSGFFNASSESVTLGEKKVVFKLPSATDLSDEYTFIFAKGLVTDASLAANKSAAVTKVVDFGDADASEFELSAGAAVMNSTGSVITVTFGEEVKGGNVVGSATNIANYSLEGVNLVNAIVTLNAGKNVATIDLSNCDVSKSDASAVFSIVNVKNSDGVTIKPYTDTLVTVDNVAPVLQSARLLSSTEIELTFNEDMDALSSVAVTSEFEIKVGTSTFDAGTITASAVSGYAKKVKLTLTNAVDTKKTITIKTKDITPNLIVDASEGNEMKKDVSVTVTKP